MKAGFFSITSFSLFLFVTSKVHGPNHQHLHNKRALEVVNEVVTEVHNVVYDKQDVIVVLDKDDKPVTTKTVYKGHPHTATSYKTWASTSVSSDPPPPPPSPTPSFSPPEDKHVVLHHAPVKQDAPKPPPSSSAAPPPPPPPPPKPSPKPAPKPAPEPAPEAVTKEAPKVEAHVAPHSDPPPSSKGPGSNGPGFSSGVAYSPYNADNSCKSSSQVSQDLSLIDGYAVIRLYGVDCNQVANVISALKSKPDVQLFLGIFDINNVASAVSSMKSGLGGNWSRVRAVSVGNELVNTGQASVGQVTAAIESARSALKQAGYSGPITTVDTMTAMKAHPELCQASDFCAINCHAFFDGNTLPSDAGQFVAKWAKDISALADGKPTVVTESGWPTRGGSNGVAVAGQSQHQQAISSLKGAFSQNLILYSAFNDLWKQERGDTFGCEKYWGLLGNAPS